MREEKISSNGNPLCLESMEVFGFKSFPERTRFAFGPGITAIVGPNGCGKTNVMDAIRWVLGEQSASSMRGNRMEEVIFSGTDRMKPLGMSEVTLTLKNEDGCFPIDYSQVSVTRRLFRSGESEYLINRNTCRLKDIQELFMDTGVGTRAYSFIEQGRVDMILSSRAEDRRFLFEEAAGIGKYKSRKRESERKLNSAEENLLRVSDVISEVRRQINSLKRQVSRAKRYSALNERLKELETLEAARQYREIKKSLEDSSKEFEEFSGVVEEKNKQVKAREAEVRNRRISLDKKEEQLNAVTERITRVKEQEVDLNSRVMLYRERIENLEARSQSAEKEKAALRGKLEHFKKELEDFDGASAGLRDEILKTEAKLKGKEQELEVIASERKNLEKTLAGIKEGVVEAASRESGIRNKKADLEAVLRNIRSREKRLKSEREELLERKKSCETGLSGALSLYENLKSELERLRNSISMADSEISAVEENLGGLRSEISSARERLNTQSSALGLMKEMKNNYEGYGSAVKALLKARPGGGGVPVGEIVEAPSELRPAIEAALQEAARCLVVGTPEEAEEAFDYLRRQEAGRAGFIALDMVDEAAFSGGSFEKAAGISGVVGRAADLAGFRRGFEKLGPFLLGRTVVARDRRSAREVLGILGRGWKVVTTEGELFSADGFLSGGSGNSGRLGLIGREKVISELEAQVRDLTSELSALEEKEKSLQSRADGLKREKEKHGRSCEDVSGRLMRAEGDCLRLKDERRKIDEDIGVTDKELEEARGEKALSEEEAAAAGSDLEQTLREKSERDRELFSVQRMLEEKRRERECLLDEITELKVAAARLKEKEESSRSHFLSRRQSCSECEREIEERQEEIRKNSSLISEYSRSIREFESGLERTSGEKEKHSGQRTRLERECRELSLEIRDMEEALSENRKSLNAGQEEMHRLEMRNSELRMRLDSLKERTLSRNRVDIEAEEPGADLGGINFENLNEEAEGIRSKLDSMGPVNLVAIEEHKELEERYSFLCSQRDDLQNAKETLEKAIGRINRTARGLFLDSFKKINASFGEIFSGLFGGGRAELVLLDENDVLESGIEIVARPPGKKLQSISLLSGGEKSMTAIALLFAILKNKPSPFCVLDEIDAALDDSNIGKFVSLVKEFSSSTQFLIVTHNKATISAASMIYGITMEEEGVSKPISIKFTDKNNEQGMTHGIEKFTGGESAGNS